MQFKITHIDTREQISFGYMVEPDYKEIKSTMITELKLEDTELISVYIDSIPDEMLEKVSHELNEWLYIEAKKYLDVFGSEIFLSEASITFKNNGTTYRVPKSDVQGKVEEFMQECYVMD